MIPFFPTLLLAFVSFISSAFVILRIVIPILPPHPLSRRVAPSEFGLPNYNFRSLSSADKSHLWLASLDILALGVFIWQVFSEYYGGPAAYGEARDAASSARLWFALTIRQTCLLVVSGLTLIHIRMGRSVSFGSKHWMLWAPTLLMGLTSTTLSGVLAGAGVPSLFVGLLAYSTSIALLSSAAFGSLVCTLVIIRRNLAALNEPTDSWPPVKEVENKPRPSFATEDIDALREGSSWLTSDAGSTHRDSVSNWSFTTHQTHHRSGSLRINTAMVSQPSLAPKSSYWFNPPTPANTDALIPPVPSLPSPYRQSPSPTTLDTDPDPFRRDVPSRPRLGSQSSWLTSPNGSQVTLSAWSYPSTHHCGGVSAIDLNVGLLANASRPQTPLSSARVLGGYGYQSDSEKGVASLAYDSSDIDISLYRYGCWIMTIWLPLTLSLPYFMSFIGQGFVSSLTPLLLVLSVTLSSPLLAMNIILRSPIPIPTGLFESHGEPPSVCMRSPSPAVTLADYNREYKRSGSVTVVEGRRSGDVWISQGDAVDGKGKLSRAFGLMTPVPRLAVLPPDDEKEDGEMTPPLPMQTEAESFNTSVLPNTPQSAEFGRMRKESVQSRISGDDFASRIMVAQRHYSALATTVVVPASPERHEGNLLTVATGIALEKRDTVRPSSSHIRSRSVSSVIGQAISTNSSPTPPPSTPLPPTPPNVRLAKQQSMRTIIHRKSYSSGFSFGAEVNDDINEIDVLTAGVLPLLVPGLKVGSDMKIKDFEFDPPISSTVTKKKRQLSSRMPTGNSDFDMPAKEDWGSLVVPSTPANGTARPKKTSSHKRHHLSLSSLGLGRDIANSWKTDIGQVLAAKISGYTSINDARRKTVWGGESVPNLLAHPPVNEDNQPTQKGASLSRSVSTRSLSLRVEVPHGMDSARTSVVTLLDTDKILPPPSAASTVTLFDAMTEFEPPAQSTPYGKEYLYSQKYQAAAMSRSQYIPTSKRSSIVYIKSADEQVQAQTDPEPQRPMERNNANTSPRTLTQWSSRAVRPLIPKSDKQRKEFREPARKSGSNSLRTLSLLQDRDSNRDVTGDVASNGFAGTRPLVLGKKKSKVVKERDENVAPSASSGNKYLKPLQLGRTDSSKVRGMLRKDETLPSVIVRPPSDRMESICEVR